MFLELFLGIILLGILYSLSINWLRGLPPGPLPLPIIGNLLSLSRLPSEDLRKLRDVYGPVFTIWMPSPVVVIVKHEIFYETIIKGGDTFGMRPQFKSPLLKFSDAYGLTWKDQRRFALHAFKEIGFVGAEYQGMVLEYAKEVIRDWTKSSIKNELIDITYNLQSVVTSLVWKLNFGKNLPFKDPIYNKLTAFAREFSDAMVHPCCILLESIPYLRYLDALFGYPIRKAEKSIQAAEDITEKELKHAESIIDETDRTRSFADAYLKEIRRRKNNGIELEDFTRERLIGSATVHWLAGIESTVTMLRFGIHYLVEHPEVQRKMQAEIDASIGDRDITMDDQKLIPYCTATVTEIIRYANIGELNMLRATTKRTMIGGFSVPAGTKILPNFPSLQHDCEIFDKPDQFIPERFLNSYGEFVKDHRFTPFSFGARACPGEGLAKMEIFVYLTTFVQKLSFANPTTSRQELSMHYGLTKSLEPFMLKITPRK